MKKASSLLSVVLLLAALTAAQLPKSLEGLKGKTIHDFQLRDLSGKTHRFSQFRGKAVLLNFWSPY